MHKKYFFFDIDQTLGVGITKVVPPDTQYCLDELCLLYTSPSPRD